MLNYNKIHSSINLQRTAKTTLSKFMGIANSTLIDRLEKQNLTPDDVEKIADFFGNPIAYYFDREENQPKAYVNEDRKREVNDPEPCKDCEVLKEKVKMLEKINQLQEEKIFRLEQLDTDKERATKNSA